MGGRLQGKVAIVTAAGNGIGRASATRFAEEGASVLVADIDEAAGQRTVAEITAAGGTASVQRTDVTIDTEIKAMVDAAVERYGKLDILFNNAGGARKPSDPGLTPLEQLTGADLDHGWALNVKSVFFGMKYAIPEMRKVGGGVILCTSSDAGLRGPVSNLPHYAVVKAGVNRLIQSASQLLGRENIRLNGVAPGFTLTDAMRGNLPPGADETVLPLAQPLPRAGLPVDIANAAVFLASDEGSFITGIVLPVDGGWYAQTPHNDRFTKAMAEAVANNPDAANSQSSLIQR